MKRLISFMLSAILLLCSFTACEAADTGQATITVVIEEASQIYFARMAAKAEELYDIKVEFVGIPDETNETRSYVIQQMRTEIMAGKGPDLFLLPSGGETINCEPLFLNVEEAMHSGIFLPLDDLIAEAEILNMENHFQVIMDAGKVGDKQLVLPLIYNYEMNSPGYT